MAPPPSDTAFSAPNQRHHKPDDENYYYANGFAEIRESKSLAKNENVQKERQISIDPISLRESPVVTSSPKKSGLLELPTSLLPGKPKFLSCSLPNSANSSPRFSTSLLKKKVKNEGQGQAYPLQNEGEMQMNLPLEYYLRRSKSCAEGRSFSPSDDLDLWLQKPGVSDQYGNKKQHNIFSKADNQLSNKASHHNSKNSYNHNNNNYNHNNNYNNKNNYSHNNSSNNIDMSTGGGFKCGACLFLPGFGKARPVRASRKEEVEVENVNVISRTVSLEKFECGSWASSVIGGDGDSSMNHYFDLPMELIQTGNNDANSPVSAAFVFDKDIKGVLKHGSARSAAPTAARKSNDSARHVRFSTASPQSFPASPTCITPRLRKAREDFNAFLEAQSA
ncbi:uncharacterized protein LOC133802159 [Humulus lupulus]|uniref:uncharacterized protein LOC133802159 n=1 Tax=Humulus lupulus TaxID=3486 RepID=UPI002B401D39|nr:uncharacterized protein LOC133802159 [Humulus lupulus]